MLNRVIKWALENRLLVVAITCLIFVYGCWVMLTLPIDVFPDLNRPTVTIMTEAGGLAPEEVETLVTFPIETLLNGAPGVERVRSQSGIGLSVITVEFNWGTDIYIDRQLVSEKLSLAREQLPQNVTPVMTPISSIMGEIMLVSVRSKSGETSPLDIRTLADWTIRPRLLSIAGIAQVTNIGGGVKQYQALVSPEKLKQFNITIDQIAEALKNSNTNTTGGFVDSQSQEYLIRNIARFNSLDELKNTVVVYRSGLPIKLGDVATVEFGAKIKRGDGGTDAKPAVIMAISKQPGSNTLTLTTKVDSALKELQKTVSADVEINSELFRQSNFIQASIHNVVEALRDGAILVIIVLFLFLLNFRTTAITLTAIPLSFVVTFLIFKWFGVTINTMTLGGLAVAIGELVDDSIVDIENIFRRLRENHCSVKPKPAIQVIYSASLEIRSSIVYATVIVALVFVPLFSLSGVEGRLLAPLGLAYIVSLLASLVISLTVTPVLASYLLPKAKIITKQEKESFLVHFLKRWDEKMLNWTLDNSNFVIGSVAVLFFITISVLPFVGTEFLPSFNEGSLTINLLAQPGTSLSESNKIGQVAEQILLGVPEVKATGRRTGRAELDEHAEGVHYTEIDVDLKESKRPRKEVINDIRQRLTIIAGVAINIGQPISHRIDHLLSGVRAQIAIKLFGDDLNTLRINAEEIRQVVASVSGTTDVQVEKQVLIPQIRFEVNRQEAARYGLQPGKVAETLETALNGKVVSEAIEGQRRYSVVVRFDDKSRSFEALKNVTIDTPAGIQIPVSAVANITEPAGPNQVLRENTQRRIVVLANTSNRDLGSVVQEIQSRLGKEIKLPTGYFIEYGGQFESQKDATQRLTILSVFSLIAIFFLLLKALGSWRAALQVMINVPLALIGAIIAMLLTGGVFSVATLVGFISLVGITSRNGIMMISHYLHLIEHEGESFSKKMVIRGSLERLVPVLMTALTAGLSLIPLALASGQPGKEILQPLAVVVLGGILTSTILDQAVTPAVFYKFGKPLADKIFAQNQKSEIKNKTFSIWEDKLSHSPSGD